MLLSTWQPADGHPIFQSVSGVPEPLASGQPLQFHIFAQGVSTISESGPRRPSRQDATRREKSAENLLQPTLASQKGRHSASFTATGILCNLLSAQCFCLSAHPLSTWIATRRSSCLGSACFAFIEMVLTP